MKGQVGILNVGCGDTKLSFDPTNPAERIRAARIVTDMIRRGYALLVEVGHNDKGKTTYRRAMAFDEDKCEYIIADFDGAQAETEDNAERTDEQTAAKSGRKAIKTRRIRADSVSSVAVSRTAGG